jgi:hypothetical protein
MEDCSQCGIGPNGPRFLSWAYKTMYYWYKIAVFDETPEDKSEAETVSVDYIIFSNFSNSPSLCSVKSQLPWANRPNAAWKRVK